MFLTQISQKTVLYQKTFGRAPVQNMPSKHLKEYLSNQNIYIDNLFTKGDSMNNINNEVNSVVSSNEEPQIGVVESPNFTNTLGQGVGNTVNSLPKDSFPTEIV